MNVKELKQAIADLPDDMTVMLDSNIDEGIYGMAQTAVVRKVDWQSDEIPESEWPSENCLVLSDEC